MVNKEIICIDRLLSRKKKMLQDIDPIIEGEYCRLAELRKIRLTYVDLINKKSEEWDKVILFWTVVFMILGVLSFFPSYKINNFLNQYLSIICYIFPIVFIFISQMIKNRNYERISFEQSILQHKLRDLGEKLYEDSIEIELDFEKQILKKKMDNTIDDETKSMEIILLNCEKKRIIKQNSYKFRIWKKRIADK